MSLKSSLAKVSLVRWLVLKVLKNFQRDILIVNPYSSYKLKLNSYRHKSYWYYSREREKYTMRSFSRLIQLGDTVIEVGGHIGYITQFFSKLVGEKGQVIVFEPGSNNLRYIKYNVGSLHNVKLVPKAVSSKNGKATFYEDDISGENNSLLCDYKTLDENAKSHYEKLVRTAHEVDVVTIDSYVKNHDLNPNFLKIDVEGCDLDVLMGAKETLQRVRSLMVEVTYDQDSIAAILRDAGFNIFDENGTKLENIAFIGNVFAIRS